LDFDFFPKEIKKQTLKTLKKEEEIKVFGLGNQGRNLLETNINISTFS